jgi:HK97 family phage portal protein
LTIRDAFGALFGKIRQRALTAWHEIGGFSARFSNFGSDIYANDIVRACVRVLAEQSSKANVRVIRRISGGIAPGDTSLQRLIQYRPNQYMNGKDFIYKTRTLLELYNIAFVFIQRDDLGRVTALYPMPQAQYEALDAGGELYIKFLFRSGQTVTLPWADLAVLRKDYNSSDLWGDTNAPILTSLDLLNTTYEGMANAIKSTANLRLVLKSTKAMLSPEDLKRISDKFAADYMNLNNGTGIASLDATTDLMPINLNPVIANYKHVEELRNNIYRYFGVNEDVLMSRAVGDAWEAFYESRLEPFLIALGWS